MTYLTQHGYVIDEVVIGLWSNEAIAEARFSHTDLAFVAFRAGHADHRHVELLHRDGAGNVVFAWKLSEKYTHKHAYYKYIFIYTKTNNRCLNTRILIT